VKLLSPKVVRVHGTVSDRYEDVTLPKRLSDPNHPFANFGTFLPIFETSETKCIVFRTLGTINHSKRDVINSDVISFFFNFGMPSYLCSSGARQPG